MKAPPLFEGVNIIRMGVNMVRMHIQNSAKGIICICKMKKIVVTMPFLFMISILITHIYVWSIINFRLTGIFL